MLLSMFAICFGCWPPPPPPEPDPDPICEGNVARIVAQTGKIYSRTSGSVTFSLANCRANYVFIGPSGQTTVFNDVSRSVTATFKPTGVPINNPDELRLYLASDPVNYGRFTVGRTEIDDLDPGITTGYYFFQGSGAGGYTLVPFNQTLYERYERRVLSWNTGTLSKVWVGQSFATLQGKLGGALPGDITLWNVTHRYFRNGIATLQKSMIEDSSGPVAEPTGAFEFRETASSITFDYGESVDGNAYSTAIWIGDRFTPSTALVAVSNVQPTTVRITN
jgi:hypothetical protein